jgi:sirohydrochlorin ferrochelatase
VALAIILATDLEPHEPAWPQATLQAQSVAAACAPILGFEPTVRLAQIPALAEAIADQSQASEIFVVPTALDFNIWQREAIGQVLAEARRSHPDTAIHHDTVDPCHPLLIQCFADQVARALACAPQRAGILVAASGHGDPDSRSQTYRFMRLLWEQLGFARGEVGFIRHATPFLHSVLEDCARHPLDWLLVPQSQWTREHVEYAAVILSNHPQASRFHMAGPPGDHPAITAWLTQRITRLWQDKRARESVRIAMFKHCQTAPVTQQIGAGHIAQTPDRESLAQILNQILPARTPDRILVKVTWHGYATGTYTDPAALDLLLSALPCPAVILESHTSSRNLERAPFDWEKDARQNRGWIRQQEAEYLRRTGLCEVLTRHGAQYVNVTEAFWDEDCFTIADLPLHHPELAAFVPNALLPYRGCPLISFAKFKGPTRLAISNLFGLIPEPLRSTWHGPNITYFAQVCCDLAKLYGSLFDLYGINEALFSAVRWNRQGLYRSRWGNYDLISNTGIVTASRGLVAADILASRLQGQDVNRSAFFDVVKAELGWDSAATADPLPIQAQTLFV